MFEINMSSKKPFTAFFGGILEWKKTTRVNILKCLACTNHGWFDVDSPNDTFLLHKFHINLTLSIIINNQK